MGFDFLHNANVDVIKGGSKSKPTATVVVDDKYDHHFKSSSRVSQMLQVVDEEVLANRLTGGHFFFIDDELVDFRDGNYNGFMHTEDSIARFIDHIGVQFNDKEASLALRNNQISNNVALGSCWSRNEIKVSAYNEGGEFNSDLWFGWNPFIRTIQSNFMLWRLICENGARVTRLGFNRKVPVENRWEEHLDIASRQVQRKLDDTVTARFAQMGKERITVSESERLSSHVAKRLDGSLDNLERETHDRLRNVANIVSSTHLHNFYHPDTFDDTRLMAQLPGHLTTFDLYNMVTEVRTHTKEVDGSSNHALDKFANELLFDRENLIPYSERHNMPRKSTFSNPDEAFFGLVN